MDSDGLRVAFTLIYKTNYWGGRTSRSGKGSDPDKVMPLIAGFVEFVHAQGIESVVDLGCGDLGWMQTVVDEIGEYTGVDIVHELLEWDRVHYPNCTFIEDDVTRMVPPKVDLVLCRDVLCHLSAEDARCLLSNVARSEAEWFASTTFVAAGRVNRTCQLGPTGWYPVVLTKPPFNLPAPAHVIHEEAVHEEPFVDKSLGIWRVAQLRGIV